MPPMLQIDLSCLQFGHFTIHNFDSASISAKVDFDTNNFIIFWVIDSSMFCYRQKLAWSGYRA